VTIRQGITLAAVLFGGMGGEVFAAALSVEQPCTCAVFKCMLDSMYRAADFEHGPAAVGEGVTLRDVPTMGGMH